MFLVLTLKDVNEKCLVMVSEVGGFAYSYGYIYICMYVCVCYNHVLLYIYNTYDTHESVHQCAYQKRGGL